MKYGLNDEQEAAILAPSPTIVNASAGSGKTRCLVAKIFHLLDSGVSPTNICSITFTNKAADEMKSRIKKQHDITGMQISTIHSMCVRIIREYAQYTRLKVPFTIYDDSDQITVVKAILKARNRKESPYAVLEAIGRYKSSGTQEPALDEVEALVYEQYEQILKKNNACDFDDLLLFALECLEYDDCRKHYTELWRHILVDEVQDTSKVQFDIIMLLYDPSITKTLFLVGDLNQSIYRFRGARPQNIQDFINKHSPSDLSLTYNYRSCPEIITQANKFLQYGKPMVAKSSISGKVSLTQFNSTEEEAERIALAIKQMNDYENFAVLYRVNTRSLEFEKAFSLHQIPYKVVGDVPFFKRRVVKDLLAYLKAGNNREDIESLARIINVPKRGFGDTKIERLLNEGRAYVDSVAEEMPAIKTFLQTLDDTKGTRPLDALNVILQRTSYKASLDKDSDIAMVDALLDVAAGFDSIESLILGSSFLEKDSGHGVQLMTAHASKGLEFDRVFVVGVEFELWPHKLAEDLQEEARLYYVAMTRSRYYLNISYSRSRSYRGERRDTYPSDLFRRTYLNIYGKEMAG